MSSSNEIHQNKIKYRYMKYAMEIAQWNSQDGDNYLELELAVVEVNSLFFVAQLDKLFLSYL